MKLTLIAVASTVVALSAQAEDMPGMKKDAMPMEGMQMKQETKQAPVAKAEGTIKAVDTTKHTVTIAHGAVPALQWPAMTMAFNATTKQLAGLKVGDQVAFEFRAEGMAATIVSIKPLK
ncbi:Cation efflux system protein CusF precursor [compost metagenome]